MRLFKTTGALILSTVFILTPQSFAQWDLSIGSNYRAFPLGGGGEIETGFGEIIWGDANSPYYGFTRASLAAEGVEDYFAYRGSLEFFPISFLGVRWGQARRQSHLNFSSFDCASFQCKGHYREEYFETPLYLKFWGVILMISHTTSIWSNESREKSLDFIDPSSGLPLSSVNDDQLTQHKGYLLYDLNDSFRVGGYLSNWSVKNNNNSSMKGRNAQMWLGVFQYHMEKFWGDSTLAVGIGAGEYRSTLKTTDPTVTFYVSFAPFPKLGY